MPEIGLIELDPNFSCYGMNTEGAIIELKAIHAEIFGDETYLRHGVSLPEEGWVLDVGANAGIFSLFVHSRAPELRVLAFEPVPANLEILRRNLALHDATNVEVLAQGLSGDEEGEATFTFFPNLPGNSTRYPALKEPDRETISEAYGAAVGDVLYAGQEVTVPVERLSTVLARYPEIETVELLKVDVEGAELDVLRGIDAADWPRIRQVALEMQDVSGMLSEVTALLTEQGFKVRAEISDSADLAEFGYYNVYAVRS